MPITKEWKVARHRLELARKSKQEMQDHIQAIADQHGIQFHEVLGQDEELENAWSVRMYAPKEYLRSLDEAGHIVGTAGKEKEKVVIKRHQIKVGWHEKPPHVVTAEADRRLKKITEEMGVSYLDAIDYLGGDPDGKELASACAGESRRDFEAREASRNTDHEPYKGKQWVEYQIRKFQRENSERFEGFDFFDCAELWSKQSDSNRQQFSMYLQSGGR